MKIDATKFPTDLLPITRSLTPAYAISIIVTMIMALASAVGILYRSVIYPTEELSVVFVSTDLLNLVVGLPILLGSMWLTRKGKLIGLLCWPGALLYVVYIYIGYFGMPFNALLLPYISLVTLSSYTIIVIIASIDGGAVRQRLTGVVPARTTGGILTGIAILVIVYQIVSIVTVLIKQTPVDTMELVQWIDDLAVGSPALLVGGYQLLRHRALGYVAGAGLLLLCSTLFLGVIPVMILQPLSTGSPIDVIGITVVLLSGMVCFIPFVLFVRGVVKKRTY